MLSNQSLENIIDDAFNKITSFLDHKGLESLLFVNHTMQQRIFAYKNIKVYIDYRNAKGTPTAHEKIPLIKHFNFFADNKSFIQFIHKNVNQSLKMKKPFIEKCNIFKEIQFAADDMPHFISKKDNEMHPISLDDFLQKGKDGENFIYKNKNNISLMEKLFHYFKNKSLPNCLNILHLSVIFNQLEYFNQNKNSMLKEIHTIESDEGKQALHIAAMYGYEEWVSLLLNLNADVHSINKLGQTPLLLSARYGHEKIVQILLKHQAVIEREDGNGYTQSVLCYIIFLYYAFIIIIRSY